MDKSDEARFMGVFRKLETAHTKTHDPGKGAIYFNRLKNFTVSQIEGEVDLCLDEHDYFPSVAILKKYIKASDQHGRTSMIRVPCEKCNAIGWLWWARTYPYKHNIVVSCICENRPPESKSYKDYVDEGIAQIEEFIRNDGKMIHEDENTFKARKKKEMMKCKSLEHLKIFTKKFGLVPDEKVLPREERKSEEIPF